MHIVPQVILQQEWSIVSCFTLPYPTLPYQLPYPYPIPILPFRVLSYPTLCPILPYPVLLKTTKV